MHAMKYLRLAAVFGALFMALPVASEQITFSRGDIQLVPPGDDPISFEVEFAVTPVERRHGLMYRTALDEKAGMLFVFRNNAVRHFWMKDTPLSLDILFFTAEQKLVHVVPSAEPNNDAVISSLVPARYVLELKAGSLNRFGLVIGTALVIPKDSIQE
jgi:uncharacterized membrane protein (UPF0127 family)